jgi:hypothetical protein
MRQGSSDRGWRVEAGVGGGRCASRGAPAKALAVAIALLAAPVARGGDLSPSVPRFNPSFPVFGGGKFVNIFDSDAALTNASAHVAWALAVPLAGQYIGGRKGLWIASASWMAVTVLQESLFHAPSQPYKGYPSEVRADLVTRLLPTMLVLGWDLWRGGAPRAARPEVPRSPLRERGATSERDAGDDAHRRAAGEDAREARPLWMCPDVPARDGVVLASDRAAL